MSDYGIHIVDTGYVEDELACVYITESGGRAVFCETNTANAVPRYLEKLKELQIPPENTDYILLTHIHLDHAGGTGELLQHCPNARVIVHPKGARHLSDTSRLEESSRQVYGDEEFNRLYGSITPVPAEKIITAEDGMKLQWQDRTFTFTHTLGHAAHHMIIHDSKSNGIFTGDAFGLFYPVSSSPEFLFGTPATTPTQFDPEESLRTLDIILNMNPERVFLTHYGIHENIKEMYEYLKSELLYIQSVMKNAESKISEKDYRKFYEYLYPIMKERITGNYEKSGRKMTERVWNQIRMDADLNTQGIAFVLAKQDRVSG